MTVSERVRLGDLVDTQKGFAFKSSWYSDTGRPIVKVSDFTDDSISLDKLVCIPESIATQHLKYQLKTHDVIVQTVGSWPTNPASVVGKCVKAPIAAAGALLNQNAVKLSPTKKLEGRFLYYLLRNEEFKAYIIGTAQGAASQAAITLEAIRGYEFDLPPFSIQHRIAGILSAYDELIENNQRRIRILEEMARSLYREWFVNFRYPDHEAVPLVDSPLGPIPQGWEVRSVKDIANVIYGCAFKSQGFNADGNGLPVIRIRDIPTGASETFTDEECDAKYRVNNGHILVGMDGDFHMCIWSNGLALQNQRVARFELLGEIGNYHMFLALERPIQEFNKAIVGTTVAHLGDMHIKTIQIIWPLSTLREKAKEILEPLSKQVITLKRQTANLRHTRDLLLPRLLSGQITLSSPAAIPVEQVKSSR